MQADGGVVAAARRKVAHLTEQVAVEHVRTAPPFAAAVVGRGDEALGRRLLRWHGGVPSRRHSTGETPATNRKSDEPSTACTGGNTCGCILLDSSNIQV